MNTPQVNQPYETGEHDEVIIPTYVAECEAPGESGACLTGSDVTTPAGWYVEFHYPDESEQYRRFIPFEETS